MYTFRLVVDSAQQVFTAQGIAARIGVAREEIGGRSIVEGLNGPHDGWLAISAFNSDGYDCDEESYERLKILIEAIKINNPRFFLIEGRDTNSSLANDLLMSLDVNIKTVIDNDHGLIEELIVFRRLAEMGVDWLYKSGISK